MLQGRAAYLSPPVYGHSHFKKFWLKKIESEDDFESSNTPTAEGGGGGGVVLTKSPPLYAVNCTGLEMKSTSPPPAAVRASGHAEEEIKYEAQKSELDYTLALGVGLPDQEEEEEESHCYDGFSSGEEKIDKFTAMAEEEEAQPSNLGYGNGESNGHATTKMCADCKTVKTPLWRNGPQGPKTLCNACGIRYKKMGKRPSGNGDRPSSPSTPPISPSCKSKRKRQRDIYNPSSGEQREQIHRHQRKKLKKLDGRRSSCSLHSEADSSQVGEENRSGEALRRWRQMERIRKGLLRYGVMRNSMAKDEEEGAMLLMALSWGVASC